MEALHPVDVSPLFEQGDRQSLDTSATLQQLESAFRDVGFLIVRGHGIPGRLLRDMRAVVQQLFSLPLATKNQYAISVDNYRGYIPLGFFNANQGGYEADQYEAYKLHYEVSDNDALVEHCPLYGPNKWPMEVPGLRATVERYWSECDRLSHALLSAIAQILSVEERIFFEAFDKPLTNMTLLHYPPCDERDNQFGIHPHKDTDALTIVAPDPIGGLWLKPHGSADWLAGHFRWRSSGGGIQRLDEIFICYRSKACGRC